ncbi:hypothetical protein ACFL2D_00025 [Patescibacteria group bacterium]
MANPRVSKKKGSEGRVKVITKKPAKKPAAMRATVKRTKAPKAAKSAPKEAATRPCGKSATAPFEATAPESNAWKYLVQGTRPTTDPRWAQAPQPYELRFPSIDPAANRQVQFFSKAMGVFILEANHHNDEILEEQYQAAMLEVLTSDLPMLENVWDKRALMDRGRSQRKTRSTAQEIEDSLPPELGRVLRTIREEIFGKREEPKAEEDDGMPEPIRDLIRAIKQDEGPDVEVKVRAIPLKPGGLNIETILEILADGGGDDDDDDGSRKPCIVCGKFHGR